VAGKAGSTQKSAGREGTALHTGPSIVPEVMQTLKRTLYIQSAFWAAGGLALATVPRFVLVTIFSQPGNQQFAWVRLVGLQALGLAMLMVLVGHRVEDLWWWSWAFALVTTGMAAVVVLTTAIALGPKEAPVLWCTLSGLAVLFTLSLLYGLLAASQEQPNPQ
jgi:hypothetical protein